MLNSNEHIENISTSLGKSIGDLVRRFVACDPKVTEEVIFAFVQEGIRSLLNDVNGLRENFVVIGNIQNSDVANLYLDLNTFEVENNFKKIVKIETSVARNEIKIMLVMDLNIENIFRKSLQEGILYERGWNKKLTIRREVLV